MLIGLRTEVFMGNHTFHHPGNAGYKPNVVVMLSHRLRLLDGTPDHVINPMLV